MRECENAELRGIVELQNFAISQFGNSAIFTGTLAAIITFLIAVGAASQGGSIRGKVVADLGPDQRRALPGVVVNLRGDRLGDRTLQTVTDYEGAYNFTGLVAGEYLLSIEFQGFKKYEQKISIQIDATVEHDALLIPLPLSERFCHRRSAPKPVELNRRRLP